MTRARSALGEVVVRLYAVDGRLLFDGTAAVPPAPAEAQLARDAAGRGSGVFRTIKLPPNARFRAVAVPYQAADGSGSVVVVTALQRAEITETMVTLRVILVIGVALTTLVLASGSFLIARSALRPVDVMSQAALQIARGDLSRRIEGVTTRDEVGRLARTLNIMIGRVAQTIERERRFTADASHELRTPLATMMTSIDVTLARERDAAGYRAALTELRSQADRLSRLARQLLLLARLDATGLRQSFELIDLAEIVEAVVRSFAEARPGVRVELAGPLPQLSAEVDQELLTRALLNLLENAASHAGAGAHISVAMSREEQFACIAVEDDGPGIPPAQAASIFERFSRAGAAARPEHTGLGLAIVAAIARVHGGSARLAPTASGRGARFELTIALPA